MSQADPPKKIEWDSSEMGREPSANADTRLPVRNMKDWCGEGTIKEPRYADRAYELCSQVGNERFLKIKGQVHDIRTPTMLDKQRLHKDPWQSPHRIKSTPNQDATDFQKTDQKSRPFTVGRKKVRD